VGLGVPKISSRNDVTAGEDQSMVELMTGVVPLLFRPLEWN
jgi:hypothetical protein